MYLAGLALLLGFALIARSPAIGLLAVVFFLVFHTFVILYEEPALGRAFGSSYAAYRSSVRRWLPRRPTGRTS